MAETKSYTVTQFVKASKQPRGGFLNTKCFEQITTHAKTSCIDVKSTRFH